MDNKENEIINEEIEKIEETETKELENEVFTYTIDNNSINNDYNKNTYNDKKSLIYIAVGVIILILIIVLLIIFVNKNSLKTSKYTDIEQTMVNSAKEYYKKNSELLPILENTEVKVDSETLITNSFMKPFSEMTKEKVKCTGYVTVNKSEEEYVYFPTLNCEDKYNSETLVSHILNKGTVTTGEGLYKENNYYIYKGEYPNNYIEFDGKTWRIIKINEDKTLKLLPIKEKFERYIWDDRYNSDKEDYSGINNFSVSRILEYLEKTYEKNTFVSKKNKNLLVKSNWCIGKLPEKNILISEINLCNETYNDLYIGLIQADEVLKASIANNCTNIFDNECTNYNYFLNIESGWTLNASSDKTYNVYNSENGTITYERASSSNYIRPVININANVLYKGGNGTKDKPYKIGN